MTRKTIPLRIPQKPAAPSPVSSMQGAAPDEWVNQTQPAEISRQTPAALTITFSPEPNFYDAWKLFFLPYALAWSWARKGVKGFANNKSP